MLSRISAFKNFFSLVCPEDWINSHSIVQDTDNEYDARRSPSNITIVDIVGDRQQIEKSPNNAYQESIPKTMKSVSFSCDVTESQRSERERCTLNLRNCQSPRSILKKTNYLVNQSERMTIRKENNFAEYLCEIAAHSLYMSLKSLSWFYTNVDLNILNIIQREMNYAVMGSGKFDYYEITNLPSGSALQNVYQILVYFRIYFATL